MSSSRSERGDLSYVGPPPRHTRTSTSRPTSISASRTRTVTTRRALDRRHRHRPLHHRPLRRSTRPFRWKPLRRSIYNSFLGRSELVWSRREQPDGLQKAFGFYVSGDYQFARRWFAGARYDRSEPGRRRVAARHRPVAAADLQANRVQPRARSVPAHAIRVRRDGQRVPFPVPVCDRRARRAPVLTRYVMKIKTLAHHSSSRLLLRADRRDAQAQAQRHHDDRGPGRRSRARSAAIASSSIRSRRGYQDPHFVEAKPSFILQAAEGRPADRGRPRAGDRLAAAAHPAEPQREDPGRAPRATSTPRRRRADPRHPAGTDHPRDGRRASERQPALLARSRRTARRLRGRSPPSCRSFGPATRRISISVWPISPTA